MAEATRLAFGFCFRPLDEAAIAQDQQFLKTYLAGERSFTTLEDVDKTAQVFKLATLYFGPCFNHWLEINRAGPLSELSRYIRCWMKGEISDQAVFGAINRDTGRFSDVVADHKRVQVSIPQHYKGEDNGNEGMLNLFTLLGPGGIAKLLLSLDGKV